MRILISAYAFLPSFGGLEQQCYLLSQEFIKKGYQVDILTEKTAPEPASFEIIDNINVYRLPYFRKRTLNAYFQLGYGLIFFLVKNRKKYQFCILRAALTFYPLIFGILKFLRLFPAKTFVTADTGGNQDEIIILKNWPFYKCMVFFFNQHDYLNSICKDNYNHYLQLGFNRNKLTNIPNGAVIPSYAKNFYPKSINNFLFIGRLIKTKGLTELLQAFKMLLRKYPDKKLYIAGDGLERDYILNFIKANNLKSQVIYEGVVEGKAKSKLYLKCDCLLAPSYSEGFGLSVLEAAVYKRIIISTAVADLKAIYDKQIIFVKKKSVKDLYDKMIFAIEKYDLSKLNYDSIVTKFDIRNTANSILNLMIT